MFHVRDFICQKPGSEEEGRRENGMKEKRELQLDVKREGRREENGDL